MLTKGWFTLRQDITELAASEFVNGRRVELASGQRYLTGQADTGAGVLLASGNYANPIDFESWLNRSIDFTMSPSDSYLVDASAGSINITIPTMAQGDQFIVHNESISTNTVLILNPSFTIKGPSGTLLAGTDLEIETGNSVQLVAKSTIILEVVGAQV